MEVRFDDSGLVDTGFTLVFRFGYEMYMGQIGFTIGGRLSGTAWSVDGAPLGVEDFTLSSGILDLEGRGAYYGLGRFIPYAAVGLGFERLDDGDADFGVDPESGFHMGINIGGDYLINDTLAIGGFIGLHLVQPDNYDGAGIGAAERIDIGVMVSWY